MELEFVGVVGGDGMNVVGMRADKVSGEVMVVSCPFGRGGVSVWSAWGAVWKMADGGERVVRMAARIRDLVYVKDGEDSVAILLWDRLS